MIERGPRRNPIWPILMLIVLLSGVGLACSLGSLVAGRGETEPTPTRSLRPTFTPFPGQPTRPPAEGEIIRGGLAPGVTAVAPTPASTQVRGSTAVILFATSSPTPAPTGLPTRTPRPTASNTPAPTVPPTATPFVAVNGATINGRRGPGTGFELIGQAKQGQQLMILGKSADGGWWLVCCISNQPAWVAADGVSPNGAVDFVPVATAAPTADTHAEAAATTNADAAAHTTATVRHRRRPDLPDAARHGAADNLGQGVRRANQQPECRSPVTS